LVDLHGGYLIIDGHFHSMIFYRQVGDLDRRYTRRGVGDDYPVGVGQARSREEKPQDG
jgi:hypothetical protein